MNAAQKQNEDRGQETEYTTTQLSETMKDKSQ